MSINDSRQNNFCKNDYSSILSRSQFWTFFENYPPLYVLEPYTIMFQDSKNDLKWSFYIDDSCSFNGEAEEIDPLKRRLNEKRFTNTIIKPKRVSERSEIQPMKSKSLFCKRSKFCLVFLFSPPPNLSRYLPHFQFSIYFSFFKLSNWGKWIVKKNLWINTL